ncbi:MAG: hypothetical protein IKE70_03980 [Bacilli bacterium]|nr:hypothetical protein [Bacilli bacterium]
MGVFDKIKNALFEVEYVEVEDVPKKEKKKKNKEKEKKDVEKPIAKKIVLPGKREEKVEELKEEELKTDNFEARPMNEEVKEKPKEEFKFMDDNDFKMDDDVEQPQILHVVDDELDKKKESNFSSDNGLHSYHESYQSSIYNTKNRESRPYGMDSSYTLPVHEYGTYDKKEEKTYFKPSPIISPIYGILDKNYKKEDVVQKKEIHLSSSFQRGKVSVDDVRDKAYGKHEEEPLIEDVDSKFEVEEEEEENKVVDLNNQTKPEVKEVTMGDALEYFQDLGLEYNVDYVDVSKEQSKKASSSIKEENANKEDVPKTRVDNLENDKNYKPIKVEKDIKEDTISDDDNLFDLIDSMYQEKGE